MNTPNSPIDYSQTLLLPKTDFAMRANAVEKQKDLRAYWKKIDLYKRLRTASKGRQKFILHDGPPYANGHLHMGHALNKILKDIIVRFFQMTGYDSVYIPGWDCHGLPIEWRVEENYRSKGLNKDDIDTVDFRRECRDFAQKWINIQSDEFQRFGIEGDWQNPYTTMSYKAESITANELIKFVKAGLLYRGTKPVMWSVVEKTALAEAEIEYHDYQSDTIWVGFPIVKSPDSDLHNAFIIIWTTTPWTIPSNRAIAYGSSITYGLYEITDASDDNWLKKGQRIIIADSLAQATQKQCRVEQWQRLKTVDPQGIICHHSLHKHGYDFNVPLLEADFVTEEDGTGFVHVAPEHGPDDFYLGKKHGIEISKNVTLDGVYADHVPLFAGIDIYTPQGKKGRANEAVIQALIQAKTLFSRGRLKHNYPHSWRSKAPVIFLNTPQWFASMDTPIANKNTHASEHPQKSKTLRELALDALKDVRFIPETGQRRLNEMIANRPDWVLSRQRSWGVPITIFVHKHTQEILQNDTVNKRIIQAISEQGADVWFEQPSSYFLGQEYDSQEYEKITDILDVWFDSGTTHAFVLEQNEALTWPADLYLEGSDQHRGWFHSSLLISSATRGKAPYKQLLTHGFVVDNKGKKMSKSIGNTIEPEQVINTNGAEILRMWVASSDYNEDMSISQEIIKQNVDNYRKIRNTFRFMLGNLNDFKHQGEINIANLPELERYMLSRLAYIDKKIRHAYINYDFKHIFASLFNFCIVDLSAFYFDIRKDSLYCDAYDSHKRQSCLIVMEQLFNCLTRWLAPILCFTCEETFQARYKNKPPVESIHLMQFMDIPESWVDETLDKKWKFIRDIRQIVNGGIEIKRKNKDIGSNLDAHITIYIPPTVNIQYLDNIHLPETFITSQAELHMGKPPENAFTGFIDNSLIGVIVEKAVGKKCARSWRILEEVGTDPDYPDLSLRDANVVRNLQNR